MKTLRILIVEDELLIALDLEILVIEIVSAEVIIKPTVASARNVLHEMIDFAFLDVDVTDGKTFAIAQTLIHRHVPFAFVSASSPAVLPQEFRTAPFIPKPFQRTQIERVLRSVPTATN